MPTQSASRRYLRLFIFLLVMIRALSAHAQQWAKLPPTPELPKPDRSGIAAVNGARIWYAIFGHGSPVIMIHGGAGSSNYWGLQIPALTQHYEVIVLDSRGHGRSTRSSEPITYHLMASDVLAVMDTLHIPKAALVGWSDGGIIGLDIAINHPERLTKLFAFGANSATSGTKDVDKEPLFNDYFDRCEKEYQKLSPTPTEYKAFIEQMKPMWDNEPHFSGEELGSIKVPTWIVDGDRDELIKREDTDHMAALIPGAGELILPQVSHFAHLQDPEQFNDALLHFLSRPQAQDKASLRIHQPFVVKTKGKHPRPERNPTPGAFDNSAG
jgi:pimeloyl-ACP methyl ester carboxylesterase